MTENKLYVWRDVLCDYTCGIAFAIAESPERAIELLSEIGIYDHHIDGIKIDGAEPEEVSLSEEYADYAYGGG